MRFLYGKTGKLQIVPHIVYVGTYSLHSTSYHAQQGVVHQSDITTSVTLLPASWPRFVIMWLSSASYPSHRGQFRNRGNKANAAWGGRFERAFLMSGYSNAGPIASVYRKHEQAKKRMYELPIAIYQTSRHDRCEWRSKQVVEFFDWSYANLRPSIMCLRGSRSSYKRPVVAISKLELITGQPLDS